MAKNAPDVTISAGSLVQCADLAYWTNCAVGNVPSAADYALEIIQPRTGLDTTNRFYKAYPAIEYNVRLGVIGGVYPFTYSLTASPAGMSINSGTGEITWATPPEAGSPHSVTAQVTDSEGTIQNVSWTVTVTTAGFKFVDSVSGNDANAGTLAAPWQTFNKIRDAANTDFVYFRAGTYATAAHYDWDGLSDPAILLAYPAEAVNLDLALGGLFAFNVSNKLYIDGFSVDVNSNSAERAFAYPGSESNITIRRNSFQGLLNGSGGNNPSYLFSTNAGTRGQYTVVQDNIVTNGSLPYFYLGYANSHVLIEDNDITGITNGYGISPKDGNSMWFVRGNKTDIDGLSFNLQGYDSQGHGRGPMVVEFNDFKSTGNTIDIAGWIQSEQVIISRNTLRGRQYVRPTDPANGPFHFNKNVIINDDDLGYTDRIRIGPEGDQGTLFYDDNLVGGTADGIVDANGLLQGAYRTSNLGTHGHEVN